MSGSTAISFSSIPANERVPLFHFQLDATKANPGQQRPRTLVLGLASTSLAAAPLYVPSAAKARNVFGASSMLGAACAAAQNANPAGEIWGFPLYVIGGSSATGSIAFSGTATTSATIGLYIAGNRVLVPVTVGMTAANIASTLGGAVLTTPGNETWPAYVSNTTGATNTISATFPGTSGNAIDLRLNWGGLAAGEELPAGITATVTGFSGGVGAASLSGVAAAIGGAEFDTIVHGFTDSTSLNTVQSLLGDGSGRWSDVQQLFGHAWSVKTDTVANLLTFGAARNDQHHTVFGLYDTPTTPWELAASTAGAAAAALAADPARPQQTIAVPGALAPPVQSRFSPANQQALLSSGVATYQIGRDGTVSIQRAVTTYQSNAWGQPDQSYLATETLSTLQYVVRALRPFVTSQVPRAKLADDGTRTGPGSAVVTPKSIRAALVTRYAELEQLGLVERTDLFAEGLVVQRNISDPSRVDVLYDPYLMSGLRIFAALVQFRLQASQA